MGVDVRKVESPQDHKAFFDFPWTLYRDDPKWVPPLVSMRQHTLDKHHNPAWEYMEGDYFAAWRGDRIVGTIVAFVNKRHNEFANENVAWFGMFETENDFEVAEALLNKALEWAKGRGYTALRGPQNFTTHEEVGMLVENFSQPVLLMPYNPPYYMELIERAGFTKAMDLLSIYFDRETVKRLGGLEMMARLAPRAMERSGITVRPLNMRRKLDEFKIFRQIYDTAWDKNWGFVPLTDKELDATIKNLGDFVEPKLAFFAEVKGEPAAFAIAVPDLNQSLHAAYPRPGMPELISMAQVGWHWKVRNAITGVRLALMGVKAEFRDRGVELAMFYPLIQALLPSKYTWMDAGWILETNPLIGISSKCGGEIYKRHRFYEKTL